MDWSAAGAVALGSAIGGVSRYLVASLVLARFGNAFPLATFLINLTGSFLIGVVVELSLTKTLGVTPMVRVFAATGVLGGYTTFSTFSLESLVLLQAGRIGALALYAGGSVVLGIAGAGAGQWFARLIARA